MTPEQFVYWLQGYFEISNADNLALEQVQVIRDHLRLVFQKETPTRYLKSPPIPFEHPDWFGPDGSGALCASAEDIADMVKGLPVSVTC